MRGSRFFLLFTLVASLMAFSSAAAAAKKKQDKAFPVTVMKASDTTFKHAKIVQPKTAKKKRFLWFKKKEPKVIQPQLAPIARSPMKTKVQVPVVEQHRVHPDSRESINVEKIKPGRALDAPEVIVPRKTPQAGETD